MDARDNLNKFTRIWSFQINLVANKCFKKLNCDEQKSMLYKHVGYLLFVACSH